jgi:hypothetical protein
MINPSTALFLLRLAPDMAEAVAAIVRALVADDSIAERRAIEKARLIAFAARQKRQKRPPAKR